MVHKMAWQRGNMTRVYFMKLLMKLLMKKKLFWGVNRLEKEDALVALVVDSADYDKVWRL